MATLPQADLPAAAARYAGIPRLDPASTGSLLTNEPDGNIRKQVHWNLHLVLHVPDPSCGFKDLSSISMQAAHHALCLSLNCILDDASQIKQTPQSPSHGAHQATMTSLRGPYVTGQIQLSQASGSPEGNKILNEFIGQQLPWQKHADVYKYNCMLLGHLGQPEWLVLGSGSI